jgi:hypothetical protein
MRTSHAGLILCALLTVGGAAAHAQVSYSWRYYRLGNTGIQGDNNEALWIAPDGDPYIGGYDAAFEEGGFAKFIQGENRWVNYSNVDYPVIGHPDETGCVRVTDIISDATGELWMGTWRGALRFDPAVGAGSLTRYGPGNSRLSGETVFDVERAPDGTLWFADNGCVRYQPATNTWSQWNTGNRYLAAQPKAGGGYYIWSADSYYGYIFRFDSATQVWTTLPFPPVPGDIAGMPGKDCVDDAGNFWAQRLVPDGGWETLDYRRPDGTWVMPNPPYPSVTFSIQAFKAYGDRRAVLVDGGGDVYQFNGSNWVSLGNWGAGANAQAADIDAAGNVWVCGIGGAAKRDVQTGHWQRYRVTNTSNYDNFNRDLTIDTAKGHVYTGANAAPGIGGMTRFDGTRWTGWNQLTYGLGYDWPFPNDDCEALTYRPSSGRIAVSPAEWIYGIHDWTGTGFQPLPGLDGGMSLCEDSFGRLWALDEYYNLNYHDGSAWNNVPIMGWGQKVREDPTRPGTIWAATDYEILRTDGNYSFSRSIDDFPGAATWFTGLAVEAEGIAWVGTWTQFTSTGSTLIRLDANTGLHQTFQHDLGWPFPGEHVRPMAITPDGRLWMQYDSEYPSNDAGLCWYDGTNVGAFPAPPGGEPQWGGLPHSGIHDLEVREIPGGYELWMSCVSRGLAVLTVQLQDPATVASAAGSPALLLEQNWPNPFGSSTRLGFSIPQAEHVRLTILDVAGRIVRVLVDEEMSAGRHEVAWDGRDDGNRPLANGLYLYKLDAAGENVQRRMTILR